MCALIHINNTPLELSSAAAAAAATAAAGPEEGPSVVEPSGQGPGRPCAHDYWPSLASQAASSRGFTEPFTTQKPHQNSASRQSATRPPYWFSVTREIRLRLSLIHI